MLRIHHLLLLCLVLLLVNAREQEIYFNEETPIGTTIFDLNTLSSFSISYQLLESSSLLTFNTTTNLISIARRIDRDSLCPDDRTCRKCSLMMKFYDMFHHDILQLIFHINDINDNSPNFSSSTYSISVTENNIRGIRQRLSQADDIDCSKNSVQTYELTYLTSNQVHISSISLLPHDHLTSTQTKTNEMQSEHEFSLVYDHSSAELYLLINRTLDRELQSEYLFTITAKDYLHRVSSQLILTVVDVNDHSARFTQSIYSVNISQSLLPGTNLLRVTAIDHDHGQNARIFYSLLTIDGHPNRHDFIQINSQTGDLRLVKNLTQNDSKRIWKLIVAANDGSENAIPSLATVYINLLPQSRIRITFGSNRWMKNQSKIFINENLPNATFIAYLTSDEPLQIDADDILIQKLSENSLTLLTNRSYDREERDSYSVRIRTQNDEKSFEIIVQDVNDNPPRWSTSFIEIDLDSDVRWIPLNVTDDDLGVNGQIGYRHSPHASLWPDWIDIIDHHLVLNCSNRTDQTTCSLESFHREFIIEIQAFDHGQPELTSNVKIRLYRQSMETMIRYGTMMMAFVFLLGLIAVILSLSICLCCCKREKKIVEKVSSPSSTTEQTSSADSLYGSENITFETATSCHMDMFLYSPQRLSHPNHPYASMNKSNESLTNKLFHSIQTDLSFLTDTTPHSGTYV
jgi:hypothetical protein